MLGTVIKLLGKVARVRVDEEKHPAIECYLRGKIFAESNDELHNEIAVGDRVVVSHIDEDQHKGVLHRVEERSSALVRSVGHRKPRLQVLAANVDQLVIVSSVQNPPFRTGLIDRYLVIAHDAHITPVLCLNKVDLGTPAELDLVNSEMNNYVKLGYHFVSTSTTRHDGLDQLVELLKGKRSVFVGHSGVGKTKLVSTIQPGLKLLSSAVDRRGRGKHTTTAAALISLDCGGELVDTPGIRELNIQHIAKRNLAMCFPELRNYLNKCRFSSCQHVPEPDCAVKRAVQDGQVLQSRYQSYVQLCSELSR